MVIDLHWWRVSLTGEERRYLNSSCPSRFACSVAMSLLLSTWCEEAGRLLALPCSRKLSVARRASPRICFRGDLLGNGRAPLLSRYFEFPITDAGVDATGVGLTNSCSSKRSPKSPSSSLDEYLEDVFRLGRFHALFLLFYFGRCNDKVSGLYFDLEHRRHHLLYTIYCLHSRGLK